MQDDTPTRKRPAGAARLLTPFISPHPVFRARRATLPWLLWFGLPVGFAVVTLLLRLLAPDAYHWFAGDNEFGFGENLTAALFLLSAPPAVWLAMADGVKQVPWLRLGLALFAVLAVLVAGEEWSWGQHFFGWGTPDWMAEVNKQSETNLHNMAERALDQKPRAIAAALILVGGVVLPLWRKRGGLAWLDRYPIAAWLMPSATLAPAALLVFLPRIFDRIQVWFNVALPPPFDIPTRHHQEMQETFIAMTVFLYVTTLALRAWKWKTGRE
ncbi:hypothetical protein [Caenispirillum salinarum]|uniref:hypothetical protein n=1 Tax=Caenispirillum salinarum TaxID=859058 RepID=UPI00384EDF31